MKELKLPLSGAQIEALKPGDTVSLSGVIYTARDAAHKKLAQLLESGKPLPLDLKGITVYYAGPCPAPNGKASGSCGPTTAGRVDGYTPLMLNSGVRAMIGKGGRAKEVVQSIKENRAVYFAAIGGCGALYADCIKESTVAAFPELLSEAVHRLKIENFPAVVAIDSKGNSIY